MFLGGFSTAKVAIGLNRHAVGFELSPSIFVAKLKEMKKVKPGYLLPTLRKPEIREKANHGKPWTEEDKKNVVLHFNQLIASGETKKDAIEILGKEFGRGRWSLALVLKSQGVQPMRKRRRR
jgi:site-specific DNA-methyltransferase (adenine-specific)